MSSNLQNSIWPNAGGTLGQIKVQIPTGTADDPWPTGDALIGNFVYDKGKLVGFVDTKALIANSSKTTTIPYDYFDVQLDETLEESMTINRGERNKYFIIDWGSHITKDIFEYIGCKTVSDVRKLLSGTSLLSVRSWKSSLADLENGFGMFGRAVGLKSFYGDLSSLTNGQAMFSECRSLTSFTSDLPSLILADGMFENCESLPSFEVENLSSVTTATYMFYNCKNLTSFSADLPSLTDGEKMFSGCSNLTSFSTPSGSPVNLSNLTNGMDMFSGCSKLTSFSSDLSSLTNGQYMFYNCKLDTASVQNIADTINTVSSGTIHIGIGNDEPNEQEEAAFNTIASKGWTVYVNGSQFGASGSSCCSTCCASITTLDETDGEFVAPKPYWAKPVPSDEQNAQYVDAQGNFYNILGAQFIYGDNLENYGMFLNETEAAAQMRLKKIGEEEIETA